MRNHNKLGEAVRARRHELGLTLDRIAAQAEVAPTTWRKLEHGSQQNFRSLVRRRIETTLGWPDGSLEAIANGGPVPVVGQAAEATRLDRVENDIAEVKAMLKELLNHQSAPAQAPKRSLGRRR